MELTFENFEAQLNKLGDNEYFVIEDEDGYNLPIAKVNNIARHFLVGYWDSSDSLKMYSVLNCNIEEMYEYINETYLEPDMNIISNIRKLKS